MTTGPFAEEYSEALQANCVMQATGSFIYKDNYDILYQHDWTTLANGDIKMIVTISDPRVYGRSYRAVRDGKYYVTTGRVVRQTVVFSIDSDKSITIKSASDQVETIEQIKYRGPCIPKYEDKYCYHADNALVDDVSFIIDEPYSGYTFYDDFVGPADTPLTMHSPEVGGAWTTGGTGLSTMLLTGGGALDVGGAALFNAAFAINDFEIADATMIFDMSFDPNFGSGMTIDFNRSDDNNKWQLYHSPPYFTLFEITGGISVNRGSFTSVFGCSTAIVKIITAGDSISIYFNNSLIISYTVLNRPSKTYTGARIFWFKASGFLHFNLITAKP